jgi:hypothetical protein
MKAIDIQTQIDKNTVEMRRLSVETVFLRQGLRVVGCNHPVTEDYKWEHDNGYGRQTTISGKRCVHCLWVDLWNRGSFIDPTEIE